MSKKMNISGQYSVFSGLIGHIENNMFKISTKPGISWTFEKTFFIYVQNTSKMC